MEKWGKSTEERIWAVQRCHCAASERFSPLLVLRLHLEEFMTTTHRDTDAVSLYWATTPLSAVLAPLPELPSREDWVAAFQIRAELASLFLGEHPYFSRPSPERGEEEIGDRRLADVWAMSVLILNKRVRSIANFVTLSHRDVIERNTTQRSKLGHERGNWPDSSFATRWSAQVTLNALFRG